MVYLNPEALVKVERPNLTNDLVVEEEMQIETET